MAQSDAVDPHELTRLLELWLIEEKTCEKYGLPRRTKKIITSSHVSPVSEKTSNQSHEEGALCQTGPRASYHPTYDSDLLARSLAYHHQNKGPTANPNKVKHRQSLVPATHIASLQPPPKARPQKQPRVKVDSATGALEEEDGGLDIPVSKHTDQSTSGVYIPQSAAKSMLMTASSNAAQQTTLRASTQSRSTDNSRGASPLPGTASLLSPSSTLIASQLDPASRSKRSTLNSNYITTMRSPGVDSHISLEYDPSRSGLSSPDNVSKPTNTHALGTVLEQGATASRFTERVVGRMDLKTGRYVLKTRSDSPGSSDGSHLSLRSPMFGSEQSRAASRIEQNERDDTGVDEVFAKRIPGEERRANWAEDSDNEEEKESLLKKIRRRTFGVSHPEVEAAVAVPHTEPIMQPTATANPERSASTITQSQRPAMAPRSSTAPSNTVGQPEVPAALKIRQKNVKVQEHPYSEKSASAKASVTAAENLSTHNISPTKTSESSRPQFGLFPSTPGTSVASPDLQRQYLDKSRPEPSNRVGQREVNDHHDEDRQDRAHIDAIDSNFTSALPIQNTRATSLLPGYLMENHTASHDLASTIATPNPSNTVRAQDSHASSTLASRTASHNLIPKTSRNPHPFPLLSEAELSRMTPESRALFKKQEQILRNRLNNTAVNTAIHTARPSVTNSAIPSKLGTATHTAKGSIVGISSTTNTTPVRLQINRQLTARSIPIDVPSMPRLNGQRPSDAPESGFRLTPVSSNAPARQTPNATYQSLRPVKSEISLSSRSPSTRSNMSQISKQGPSPQPVKVANATQHTIVPSNNFKSLAYHQHDQNTSTTKPIFMDKLPGLYGPPAAASLKDSQQELSVISRSSSVKRPGAPLPAAPSDLFDSKADRLNDLDSSSLNAEDGPGPMIEDPRYFAENVLNMKHHPVGGPIHDTKKSGFWSRMVVKKR